MPDVSPNGHYPQADPILKWAGGKSGLLDQYEAFFPPAGTVETYYEPFAGSGAVFFALRGRGLAHCYRLSDINEELINIYMVVRDRLGELIEHLAIHRDQHSRRHFYQTRKLDRRRGWPESATAVERAARMIYLNRTCFNGLWRENSQGQFNVPMGDYPNPTILDEPRLSAAAVALKDVELCAVGFDRAVETAQEGDFVYFDPPYVPLSATSNFTSYHADGFGAAEQEALAETFRKLDGRGVRVMLSNSDVQGVRDLYEGFRIEEVKARRRINSKGDGRGPISELVILNYD